MPNWDTTSATPGSCGADVNITRFNASNPGEADNPYIDNDSRITRGMTSFALENRYDRTSGAVSFFYNWGPAQD